MSDQPDTKPEAARPVARTENLTDIAVVAARRRKTGEVGVCIAIPPSQLNLVNGRLCGGMTRDMAIEFAERILHVVLHGEDTAPPKPNRS